MPIDFASIAANAKVAIAEAGASLPIRRYTDTFDELTQKTVRTLTQEGLFTMVVLPAKKANALAGFQTGFDQAYVEKLRAGKVKQLLIAGDGAPFVPEQGHFLVFAGQEWELLGCTPLNPNGTVDIIYKTEVVGK